MSGSNLCGCYGNGQSLERGEVIGGSGHHKLLWNVHFLTWKEWKQKVEVNAVCSNVFSGYLTIATT